MKALASLFASPVQQQLAAPQLVEIQQLSPGFTLQHCKNLAAVITAQMAISAHPLLLCYLC